MIEYILFILISLYPEAIPITTQQIKFSNLSNCMNARQQILEDLKEFKIQAICIPN